MSDEKIIMDKEDYHKILDVIKTLWHVNAGHAVEDKLKEIEGLLEKARVPEDEPVTANDRLSDQLNILLDSTTAAADDALKALNILNGDE